MRRVVLPRFGRRTVAVVAASVALAAGGTVAYAAVTACPMQSNPSHVQLEQYMKCRLDAIETKIDALAKPPVTTTVTATATVTAPPETVTITATPSTSTTTTSADTTSSTTTTALPPAGCAAKPDASNTGSTGSLTPSSQSSFTTPGATYQNVAFTSTGVTVTAPNVTFTNVRFAGEVYIPWSGANAHFTNVTAVNFIVAASGFTVDKGQVGGAPATQDVFYIQSDDTAHHISSFSVTNTWMHDPQAANPAQHLDGMQVRGADNALVQCNNFDLGPYKDSYNGVVYFEDSGGGENHNYRVDRNWLNGGVFTLYLGHHGTGYAEVTNNTFGPNALYGYCYDSAQPTWLPTLMQGNVDSTGRSVDPVCTDSPG